MNPLSEIRARFSTTLSGMVDDSDNLLSMIRPAGDSKFGDYQANCAMPLGKQLGRSPREIASEICETVQLDGLCQKIEIAGPGFINLTIDDDWLKSGLTAACGACPFYVHWRRYLEGLTFCRPHRNF